MKAAAGPQGYDPLDMADAEQADALLNDLIAKLAAVPTIAMRGSAASADTDPPISERRRFAIVIWKLRSLAISRIPHAPVTIAPPC